MGSETLPEDQESPSITSSKTNDGIGGVAVASIIVICCIILFSVYSIIVDDSWYNNYMKNKI
jgi:hypothetical protein